MNIPIVMVSRDLRIRRFTPLAEKVFNLIPTDVGRPISDIKPNLEVDDLPRLITGVIDTLAPHEGEVQDKDWQHWAAGWRRRFRGAAGHRLGAAAAGTTGTARRRGMRVASEAISPAYVAPSRGNERPTSEGRSTIGCGGQ